jgi:hypothetical protein
LNFSRLGSGSGIGQGYIVPTGYKIEGQISDRDESSQHESIGSNGTREGAFDKTTSDFGYNIPMTTSKGFQQNQDSRPTSGNSMFENKEIRKYMKDSKENLIALPIEQQVRFDNHEILISDIREPTNETEENETSQKKINLKEIVEEISIPGSKRSSVHDLTDLKYASQETMEKGLSPKRISTVSMETRSRGNSMKKKNVSRYDNIEEEKKDWGYSPQRDDEQKKMGSTLYSVKSDKSGTSIEPNPRGSQRSSVLGKGSIEAGDGRAAEEKIAAQIANIQNLENITQQLSKIKGKGDGKPKFDLKTIVEILKSKLPSKIGKLTEPNTTTVQIGPKEQLFKGSGIRKLIQISKYHNS